MADCSYARCMQERRTIKKHLQKWTKNCIYTLGFERVAEEFMGRRKWRLYQEKVLKSWCPSIENEIEIKDWDPTDDKCSFCDLEPSEKLTEDSKSENSYRSECFNSSNHNNNNINNNNNNLNSINNNNHIDLLEVEDSDTNSLSSAEDSITTMNALDSVTSMAAIAALTGPSGAPNPLLYPPGVFPRWYLPQPSRALLEGMTKTEPPMVINLPESAGSEMPLDLSAKSSKPSQPMDGLENNIRVPNLSDNKPIMKGRPRMSPMSGRRTYTEDELQAALRDIQSGKLGTRRAAVIYGIPRSTLRNKVYKLALERERDAHLLLTPIPRPSPPDGAAPSPTLPVNTEREDSSADDEKDSDAGKPSLSMEDLMRLSALDEGSHVEGLTALLHNISRLNAESVSAVDVAAAGNSVLASYLGQLLKLKENLSPESEKERTLSTAMKDGDDRGVKNSDETANRDTNEKAKYSPHLLPHLMRRIMAEERVLIEEQLKRKMGSENGLDEDQSNVILRIPSFKPNTSCSKANNGDGDQRFSSASPAGGTSQENSRHSVVSPSMNGESESPPIGKPVGISSLRNAVAKSISHKFQQEGVSPHGLVSPILGPEAIDALAKRGNLTHVSLPQTHSLLKNHFERSQQRPQHSSSAQTNTQGKGTRPKRGKYRNYDRDSLVEAVRAVQRGEMSVHRAGSYYGVPHSTLEYKVKERHLMRPRKREPKGEDKNKLTPSVGAASSAANTPCLDKPKPLALAPKPSNAKSAFSNPPALPNGLKIPPSIFETGVSPLAAYAGSPFPFWPPSPFHPLPLDISRGAFPATPEQLFAPQILRGAAAAAAAAAAASGGMDAAPTSPSALPPSTRRIAESLYDGTEGSGSFLDGIIRSSLEMGLNVTQKIEKEGEKSGKNTENMSNKALLDQLCRNSRLTPVLRPSGESNSDDDGGAQRQNVAFDLSKSSDDDYEERRSTKSYGIGGRGRIMAGNHLKADKRKSCDNEAFEEYSSRMDEDKILERRNFQENRSYRSSMSDDRSKHSSDVEINGEREESSPGGELPEDDDMDNISNHASDEEDLRDS